MRFKVTLSKRIPPKHKYSSPFIAGQINDVSDFRTRTWEIEAENKEEIISFYNDAVEKKLPNVIGFSIHSIEVIE